MRLTKLLTKTTFVFITVIKIQCSEICILYHILEKKTSNSIDPHKWNQVISNKDEDNIMEKKDGISCHLSTSGVGKWDAHKQKLNLYTDLTPFTKLIHKGW